MANEKEQEQPIIVKKVKKGGGGHHGGAWKVAYADFVTAMMAFFLLMWLLNVTTKEEKSAISNYFDPTNPKISQSESGAGGVLGGLSVAPDGAMVTNVQSITRPRVEDSRRRGDEDQNFSGDTESDTEETKKSDGESDQEFDLAEELKNLEDLEREELEKALEQLEDQEFEQIQEQIMDAIASSPDLEGLAEHIKMEITPEGLLIQIIDNEGRSMFPSASAQMYPFMYDLLSQVATAISEKPNQLSIRGHTDSIPFPEGSTYTNWDLSADRAQSSRRAITRSGYPENKIANVVGRADRDPFVPEDPRSAQNRRISMVLLRDKLTRPENIGEEELREKIEDAGERIGEEASTAERFRSRSEALRERRERISREREEQLLQQERDRQEREQQQSNTQTNTSTNATEFERERAPIERPNRNQTRQRQILEFD